MAPIVSPARTGPVWRHLLVPSGVLLVIACYEYCLVQADVVGEGGGGGVGRVSSSSLWSCSCSWPRSCSGARGIAATNAYGSEIACFAYVSNGVVERSGSTVAFVFVLYAPSVPFTCALRIAAAVARAMPCRDRGERESADVGRQVVPELWQEELRQEELWQE